MELTEEQKKAIEEQKANCIFCQIVAGKVESKKVYEDDKILGILDINPAAKGHVLVMPKEHYPIMPLIPPDEFKQLFRSTKEISKAVKKGAVSLCTNIFIANGAAAGQQSQHFMLHVIPRDKEDGLRNFGVPEKKIDEKEILEIFEPLKNNLAIMIRNHLIREGKIKGEAQSTIPDKLSKEQVMKIINSNPKLIEIIKQDPEQFKKIIPTSADLLKLFKGHDVDAIIEEITGKKIEKKDDVEELLGGKKDSDQKKDEKDKENFEEDNEDQGDSKSDDDSDEEEEDDEESDEVSKKDLDNITEMFR